MYTLLVNHSFVIKLLSLIIEGVQDGFADVYLQVSSEYCTYIIGNEELTFYYKSVFVHPSRYRL